LNLPLKPQLSTKAQPAIRALKISFQQEIINPTQYADNVNTIIVSALQVTAQEIFGTTAFRGKHLHLVTHLGSHLLQHPAASAAAACCAKTRPEVARVCGQSWGGF